MNQITIVGMGPGAKHFLTIEALDLLTSHSHVWLRTDKHPVVDYLVEKGMSYHSFDHIYESSERFEETYDRIANEVIELSQEHDVVYAVPGNAFVAEKTVQLILDRAQGEVKIVHGVSFIDAIISTLQYDPVSGMAILDAFQLEEEEIISTRDLMVIQVYNQMIASKVKLRLMAYYDDEQEVTLIRGAGIPGLEVVKKIKLFELDRYPELTDHLTSLFIPHTQVQYRRLYDLENIMKRLRGENGCPWDREQTHESLANDLIEEAYEVKHAIEHEEIDNIVDELGDVLLHVVFHSEIGLEEGYFDIQEVIHAICTKMIRRHPHVFGDESANTSEEVLDRWQEIKNKEKASQSVAETMSNVSFSLPSLTRAQKVQKHAAKCGFDWESVFEALSKVDEEVLEVKEAIESGQVKAIQEEIGDLLLIIANVARLLDIDAEEALQKAIEKFIQRFAYVEGQMQLNAQKMDKSHLKEMNDYWNEAKKCQNS